VQRVADLRLDRDAVFRSGGACATVRGEALWPRIEDAASDSSVKKGKSVTELPKDVPVAPAPPAPASAPADTRLSIDDFMKIDLRVAKILAAERVANSKKLVRLEVDLGSEQRTVVAGIAEAYEAAALVGRTVTIVANLKPAKLMGIESNGMVLAATGEDGKPILVSFEQTPAPGTRVR
jgi:methionyl-tRNA synthetase